MNQDSPNVLTKVLAFSSVVEIGTGLALMIEPALVVRLLMGNKEALEVIYVARFLGIALFALGIACWPNEQRSRSDTAAFRGMLTYNMAVASFLAYLFIVDRIGGVLLWPGVILHAIVAVIMIWVWRGESRLPVTGHGS